MALTEIQVQIREHILSAVRDLGSCQIVYESEWLGYLPWGAYHWIQCKDQRISNRFPMVWQESDLLALEREGTLEKLSEWQDPIDDLHSKITYEVCLAALDRRPAAPCDGSPLSRLGDIPESKKGSENWIEPVSRLDRLLEEISDHIAFIRRELPSLEMSEVIRLAINGMCHDFDSTLYDVRKEVRTLEDKLGMHPSEEPFDPDVNPDPRVTLSLIRSWLRTEMESLNGIVTKLRTPTKDASATGTVFGLVAESGAGILRAFGSIQDTLTFLESKLPGSEGA